MKAGDIYIYCDNLLIAKIITTALGPNKKEYVVYQLYYENSSMGIPYVHSKEWFLEKILYKGKRVPRYRKTEEPKDIFQQVYGRFYV